MLATMKLLAFLVWTWIGIVAWRVYVLVPGDHRRLRMWAFALGLAGAWTGGFIAAMVVHGRYFTMDWKTVVGSLVGAGIQIALFDLIARSVARDQVSDDRAPVETGDGPPRAGRRAS